MFPDGSNIKLPCKSYRLVKLLVTSIFKSRIITAVIDPSKYLLFVDFIITGHERNG